MIMPRYWRGVRRQAERERLGVLGRARRLSRRLSDLRTEASTGELAEATFFGQVTSIEYMGMVLWYTLNLTWILYYFTYAGPIVNDKLFCQMIGYVGNGLPGLLSLFVGNVIARFGWAFATCATSLLSIGMLVLSTVGVLWLDYVALLFFSFARGMVFAVLFSYIPITFGVKNYGRLIGVATLISGAFGFVDTPLGQWASLHQDKASSVCPTGIVCESSEACNITSWTMAASLVPMLLYSVWLCRHQEERRLRSESPTATPNLPPTMASTD